MKELINIQPHPSGNGYDAYLRNGFVSIPDATGAYVISTGMGSGKTESIKSLIRHKWQEGILYCVDTKAEATKMNDFILSEIVSPESGLKQEDVILLHGDNAEQLLEYQNQPEILIRKKIIILTHVRFFTDLINYFLVYEPDVFKDANLHGLTTFDCNFKALMTRDDLRKYIVFDETPVFLKPFATIHKSLLGMFSDTDNNGKFIPKPLADIHSYYNRFLKGTRYDLAKNSTKISVIKKDLVLNSIHSHYNQWMSQTDEDYSIRFLPNQLVQEGMKTHLLLFEGAGDILFAGSRMFKLIDVPQKYDSKVIFQKFSYGLKRHQPDHDSIAIENALKNVADIILQNKGQSLIVVWKDMGKKAGDNDEDVESLSTSPMVEEVNNHLSSLGVTPERYDVIYYGSSLSKSTNVFRDYSNIILCGNWNIRNNNIKEAFLIDTKPEDVKMWYYSQLICRIGIRRHQGGEFKVFYSEDIPEGFMTRLSTYFNNNRYVKNSGLNVSDSDLPEWVTKLTKVRISKTNTDKIIKLGKANDKIANAIEGNRKDDITITLQELNNILGSNHRIRDTKNLCDDFKKIGINLNIVSNKS